ncbi:MAG: carboxymuconolactone decarboxylase family protein [Burkholderiaceae bacterium]
MARIPYIDDDTMPVTMFAHEKAALSETRRANLYRALPVHRALAGQILATIDVLVKNGTLGIRLRELVILRVAARSHCAYEIHHHKRIAARGGISVPEIDAALLTGDDGVLPESERRLLRYVDALVIDVKAPGPLFDAVCDDLGVEKAVEVIHLVGFYMSLARFLETTEVDIESDNR